MKGFQEHIRRTIRVGEVFTELVRGREDVFEIVAEPRFGLTVFTVQSEVAGGLKHGRSFRRSYRLVSSRS